MKKHLNIIAMIFFFAIMSPSIKAASTIEIATKENISMMTEVQQQQRIEEIKERVQEIKAMDKSQLTKEDRVALKEELKNMKHEARIIRGGVFISAGALIIIIILLIIIL